VHYSANISEYQEKYQITRNVHGLTFVVSAPAACRQYELQQYATAQTYIFCHQPTKSRNNGRIISCWRSCTAAIITVSSLSLSLSPSLSLTLLFFGINKDSSSTGFC
jgi:hypothetical protein